MSVSEYGTMTQRKKLSHDKIAKWARSIVQELSSSFRNINLPIPKILKCMSQSNLKFFQIIDQGAFSSVQFSLSVMSDSLQPHGRQQARLPCPSPTPRVYSNSCPLSQWCHPTVSSSAIPFSSCLQSFPASDLFKWVSSSHQVAKVLEFQFQHQSFQWIFRTDFF